jgi:hypothetical protein
VPHLLYLPSQMPLRVHRLRQLSHQSEDRLPLQQ